MALGPARITVHTPHRRLDVAVPQQVPVAELLPELLRHAGDGLADAGEQHGGWVLRRLDGVALAATDGLRQQGVRDGEVLQLAPARLEWPEPEYDDVVETIAVGARRRGVAWSPAASRRATLAAAGAALAVGLLALMTGGGPGGGAGAPAGFAVAVALLLAGVVASRAYGDARAGATLGGSALPYAFVAGTLLVATGPATGAGPVPWLGAPQLLVGAVSALLAAVLGLVGVATGLRVFVAGVTAGGFGAAAALGGYLWGAAGAAAVLACVLVCGVGLVPLVAIRLGRLPMPPVDLPAARDTAGDAGGAGAGADPWRGVRQRPDRDQVFAAVARTEEVLSGALLGHAVLSVAAVAVLVADGGVSARLLAGVAGLALVLRARLFVAVRHRVPLLVAGVTGLTALGAALALGGGAGLPLVAVAVLLAFAVAAGGAVWADRPPSPYLGRTVDILDTVTLVSVVPIAASVLGLYGQMRGLTG